MSAPAVTSSVVSMSPEKAGRSLPGREDREHKTSPGGPGGLAIVEEISGENDLQVIGIK
jgi:hypothetical protein